MKKAIPVPLTDIDIELDLKSKKSQVDVVLGTIPDTYMHRFLKYLDVASPSIQEVLVSDRLYTLYIRHRKEQMPRLDIETYSLLKNTVGDLLVFYPAKFAHDWNIGSVAFKLDITVNCKHDTWFLNENSYGLDWWVVPYKGEVGGVS
jgi:hypothetical protein